MADCRAALLFSAQWFARPPVSVSRRSSKEFGFFRRRRPLDLSGTHGAGAAGRKKGNRSRGQTPGNRPADTKNRRPCRRFLPEGAFGKGFSLRTPARPERLSVWADSLLSGKRRHCPEQGGAKPETGLSGNPGVGFQVKNTNSSPSSSARCCLTWNTDSSTPLVTHSSVVP